MKKLIKSIPFIGDFAVLIYRRIRIIPEFTTSQEYWENRYRRGGNSGAGSYNNLAEFKGEVINNFLVKKNIDSVIEFGSGDGNQLKYLNPKEYLGYEVSEKAIQLCEDMYQNDNTKSFKSMNTYNNEKADLTMSLDVIYHLIEDDTFSDYITKLFESSNKYVIIYSSNTDENTSIDPHVKQRKFTDWVEVNQPSFKLIEHIPNKYPYNGDGERTSIADFYIYEKSEKRI